MHQECPILDTRFLREFIYRKHIASYMIIELSRLTVQHNAKLNITYVNNNHLDVSIIAFN